MENSFGPGIFRPYADFIDDIAISIDNQTSDDQGLAAFSLSLIKRDFVFIRAKDFGILCISSGAHRRHPFRACPEWHEFCHFPEEVIPAYAPAIATEAVRIKLLAFDTALIEKNNFLSPVFIGFPSKYMAQAGAPDYDDYQQTVKRAAALIVEFDSIRYKEHVEMQKPKDIFLSHKSVDKAIVREVANTLKTIGYSPWLDEDRLKAGANLDRALKQGFDDSCAAVFFITPNFVDQGYLADEIDYAVTRKRELGDRFSIVTLLLSGDDGVVGQIPEMLRKYVWKPVQPIEIVRTIVEAIPIRLGPAEWRV